MAFGVQKNITLTQSEYWDLKSYCDLNFLDQDKVIKNSYLQGFRIEKYGLLSTGTTENIKEVVKYVEVPVEIVKEIIKEVPTPPTEVKVVEYVDREVIVEVPVEKIVEKVVNICDNSQIEELLSKIQELENREPQVKEIIKEVVVEKEVKDDKKVEMISQTLTKLKLEIIEKNKKIEEMERVISEFDKFKQKSPAIYLRGSNLDETLQS
jgi:hypothetical protein